MREAQGEKKRPGWEKKLRYPQDIKSLPEGLTEVRLEISGYELGVDNGDQIIQARIHELYGYNAELVAYIQWGSRISRARNAPFRVWYRKTIVQEEQVTSPP